MKGANHHESEKRRIFGVSDCKAMGIAGVSAEYQCTGRQALGKSVLSGEFRVFQPGGGRSGKCGADQGVF